MAKKRLLKTSHEKPLIWKSRIYKLTERNSLNSFETFLKKRALEKPSLYGAGFESEKKKKGFETASQVKDTRASFHPIATKTDLIKNISSLPTDDFDVAEEVRDDQGGCEVL